MQNYFWMNKMDDKKLERYMAKSEIYELVCKYMRGLDRLDRPLLKSVFLSLSELSFLICQFELN